MTAPLPDYRPATEEIEPPLGFVPAHHPQAAQFPPLQKLDDGRLVVDVWWSIGGIATLKVWEQRDHPNLTQLPANAPRMVKALYQRRGQLAYLRGDYELAVRAMDAWEAFQLKRESVSAAT